MSRHFYSVYPGSWPMVAEHRHMETVDSEVMDDLWAAGWRHFGTEFFRSSLMADEDGLKRQIPLRIRLGRFSLSKSQRRTMRRNESLEVEIGPATPGAAEADLFHRHKTRFARNVPERLEDFLGARPADCPCGGVQFSVFDGGKLIAASYLSLGKSDCSSIYAVFDPDHGRRRLGIYTMLLELRYTHEHGYRYYYSGYATVEPSCYDYKRQFSALDYYDWEGRWLEIEELPI